MVVRIADHQAFLRCLPGGLDAGRTRSGITDRRNRSRQDRTERRSPDRWPLGRIAGKTGPSPGRLVDSAIFEPGLRTRRMSMVR